jgi:phosphoglycerol transferase MdoB-like AlkP superfamily enzyme
MQDRLKLFFSFALFWLGFQLIIRAVFLLYNHRFASGLNAGEIFLSFTHGLKMDASISGYFLAISGLLLIITVYRQGRLLAGTFQLVTAVLLLVSAVIVVVDIELYRHWGFRLNTTPLFYAGSEAVGSVDLRVLGMLILVFIVLFGSFIWLYRRFLHVKVRKLSPTHTHRHALILLAITGLLFIPIRGSFTVAPMNTGFVYFHKTKTFANHAAINVVWNFLYSLSKSSNVKYPENFFDAAKTEQYFSSLYPAPGNNVRLFSQAKPNVILFILESFTADVVGALGGAPNVAPNINQLASEGILFDQFYSSGDRTDKGLISILSGYPAQPTTSIIKFPGKTQRLPYLTHRMNELGYQSSFVYGGDIDFANFRSYLTACRFSSITTEDDFPSEWNVSKWGVHDHYVLERALAECDTARGPFFKVVLTLSSHEPFDVPHISEFSGSDEASLFLNSCHYTDKAIGDFVSKARQAPWWNNTVLIFVADHGHRLPKHRDAKEKERFRIPFIIAGGAIKRDTVIHTIGGQTDIAKTLLGQFGVSPKEFLFSKDLVAENAQPFATYFFNDGYGFITADSYVVFDNTARQFLRSENATDEVINKSKAYQQMLFTDYNKR